MDENRLHTIDTNSMKLNRLVVEYYKDTQHNQENDVEAEAALNAMMSLAIDILYELNEEQVEPSQIVLPILPRPAALDD